MRLEIFFKIVFYLNFQFKICQYYTMRVVFTNININLKNECTFHVNVCIVIYPNYELVMKQTCNLNQSESFRFHFFRSFFLYNLLSYAETVTVDKSLTFIFFLLKILISETCFCKANAFLNFFSIEMNSSCSCMFFDAIKHPKFFKNQKRTQ